MSQQLSLPVTLPDDEVFDSFVAGENRQVESHLLSLDEHSSPFLTYLFGDAGVGKSHLLYALCHQKHRAGQNVAYISLSQMSDLSPSVLMGLEACDYVCIDDLERGVESLEWQQALFDLINRINEQGHGHLVIAAKSAAKTLQLELSDLQSRLTWGISFKVLPLDDELKMQALQLRAKRRGLEMSADVARFLINHYERDMVALMAMLEQLDRHSLQQQRKLTVPFIKSVFEL